MSRVSEDRPRLNLKVDTETLSQSDTTHQTPSLSTREAEPDGATIFSDLADIRAAQTEILHQHKALESSVPTQDSWDSLSADFKGRQEGIGQMMQKVRSSFVLQLVMLMLAAVESRAGRRSLSLVERRASPAQRFASTQGWTDALVFIARSRSRMSLLPPRQGSIKERADRVQPHTCPPSRQVRNSIGASLSPLIRRK